MEYFKNYFQKYNEILSDIEISNFIKLEKLLKSYKNKKNRVFIFGNGGSSSISSHVATDLTKICKIKGIKIKYRKLSSPICWIGYHISLLT